MIENINSEVKDLAEKWATHVLTEHFKEYNEFIAEFGISVLPEGFLPNKGIFIKDGKALSRYEFERLFSAWELKKQQRQCTHEWKDTSYYVITGTSTWECNYTGEKTEEYDGYTEYQKTCKICGLEDGDI